MDRMRRQPAGRSHNARLAVAAALTCTVAWAAVGPAAGAGEAAELGLLAVGQSASYFDLTMLPGETLTLEVEITNNSDAQASAHTYAADVHTTVNGGFGGRLRDEPTSGTTRWLDYESETLRLAVGERVRRSFTVTVPDGTGPGEYITSVVLETELQAQRQALGVVVTVPGTRSPALEIGQATHAVVGGTSLLSVALSNPGNVRLSPMVELEVFDAAGAPVGDASVQMDSFYAGTDTSVEVALDSLLPSGTYSIDLVAEDVQQEIRETDRVTLVVGGDSATGVIASIITSLTTIMRVGTTDIPVVLVVAVLGGVAMVAGTMHSALDRRRRRPQGSDGEG